MQTKLYSISDLPAGKVSIAARPRGGEWLVDEIKALREAGVDVLVSLLTYPEIVELALVEEAVLSHQENLRYFSYPIDDFSVPPFTDETFHLLKQLHVYLDKGMHVALHCRQGLGRSVLIAASLLVLTGFSPERAFAELSQKRGYTVPETEEQKAWVVAFAQHQQYFS